MWALLAKEAVLLGNCGAAAEYLAAAQKHNDAFHDQANTIRYSYTPPHCVVVCATRLLKPANNI